jgi:hypothetical protein
MPRKGTTRKPAGTSAPEQNATTSVTLGGTDYPADYNRDFTGLDRLMTSYLRGHPNQTLGQISLLDFTGWASDFIKRHGQSKTMAAGRPA